MKWKLYYLCCLYNIIACLGCIGALLYFIISTKDGSEISIFLVMIPFLICIYKNYMGLQMNRWLQEEKAHSTLFAAGFYFLWFFNVVIFLFIVFFTIIDFSNHEYNHITNKDWLTQAFYYGRFIINFTFPFTLVLDLILERKNTLQKDPTIGLLESDDKIHN